MFTRRVRTNVNKSWVDEMSMWDAIDLLITHYENCCDIKDQIELGIYEDENHLRDLWTEYFTHQAQAKAIERRFIKVYSLLQSMVPVYQKKQDYF